MSDRVQSGLVQLVVAVSLLYAFWSGALAALIDGLTRGIRGEDPGTGLYDALTSGGGRSMGGEF